MVTFRKCWLLNQGDEVPSQMLMGTWAGLGPCCLPGNLEVCFGSYKGQPRGKIRLADSAGSKMQNPWFSALQGEAGKPVHEG